MSHCAKFGAYPYRGLLGKYAHLSTLVVAHWSKPIKLLYAGPG